MWGDQAFGLVWGELQLGNRGHSKQAQNASDKN